jgi:hypothetical protein
MSGNKAMRRALESKDAYRIGSNVPLLTDETMLVDPEKAHEFLKHNRFNRPPNYRKAREYARIIGADQWKLHSQGIIFDSEGNLLTGQTRLMAIILADKGAWLRISRGNPKEVANFIDRGRPQSARDLATRKTEQSHSPAEASIARAICALNGELKPSPDIIAVTIVANTAKTQALLEKTHRTKKTKAVLMILAAITTTARNSEEAERMAIQTENYAAKLDIAMQPLNADKCWNKGAAFRLAMDRARSIVANNYKQ